MPLEILSFKWAVAHPISLNPPLARRYYGVLYSFGQLLCLQDRTSAKEVMFLLRVVCWSVCLSVCQQDCAAINYRRIFIKFSEVVEVLGQKKQSIRLSWWFRFGDFVFTLLPESVGVGRTFGSVCLFVHLFVCPSITQKRMTPQCSNLVWNCLSVVEMTWFWGWKVKRGQ